MKRGRGSQLGSTNQMSRRHFLAGSCSLIALASAPSAFASANGDDGQIELVTKVIQHKLAGDRAEPSEVWTYNGLVPGQEIRIRQGEKVRVRLQNELPEGTSIHWHGIRIDNAMDGVSGLTQDPVPQGSSFDYEFVAPDAGTYWYHAHNKSWNQVGRGLYGPLIVEEAEPPFARENDLTLVMDDWRLDDSGALETSSFGSLMDWSHGGRLGNWITVNGQSKPAFELKAGVPYRLRLINVSNARILEMDLARLGGTVIALDGQPVDRGAEKPAGLMSIGPAQRVDIGLIPQADQAMALVVVSRDGALEVATFTASGVNENAAKLPTLPLNEIAEPDLSNALPFTLDMTGGAMGGMRSITYKGKVLSGSDFRTTGQAWAFNGVANLPEEPFFQVERGKTVLLETINNTAWPHAMHSHGHHFRVLNEDGTPGPWRDTFLIAPDERVKIAFVADNPGKWLLHCHMLEHAAAGMTTWYSVL